MPLPGSSHDPLRVAVIGSGPAGFYTAEQLFKKAHRPIEIDMFERLPTPFGLVRFGVAPDHEKIKNVTKAFEKIAQREGFRFFGNVDVGTEITLADLETHYHQICYATGAQTDRRMGIPGEDLVRSHPATEFVAWYNGHPDYTNREFDLSVEQVAVVGVGNVAVDVARILCRTPDELRKTDIADYALEQLAESRVREVYMLGRRGPAQAAFSNPEVRELGEMEGSDITVLPGELELDDLSRKYLADNPDRTVEKKLEILREFAARTRTGKPRNLTIRFLVSPVELTDRGDGSVGGMRLVRNELYKEKGRLRPRATGEYEELPVELVFRSVGYHGIPIPGLPFNEAWGVVPNEAGRVVGTDSRPLTGVYVSGWIKRGPSGVIGTNKPDAAETVDRMLEDMESGALLEPSAPDRVAVLECIQARQPGLITWEDWKKLDEIERERGRETGRPRIKFTSVAEMLAALGK